ncbi:CRTAC1 family protein [Pseudomonas sp. S36]|nr:CRTAC1 family protein [Pseudomonas sp. S36]
MLMPTTPMLETSRGLQLSRIVQKRRARGFVCASPVTGSGWLAAMTKTPATGYMSVALSALHTV